MSPAPTLERPPRRVALVRMSAIGDTVHVLPIIASLRAAWPDCRITWVVQPVAHRLWTGRPDVDEFLIFHRERGARAYRDFRRALGDRRFDLVICLHPCLKAAIVTRLLSAPIRLGYDRARSRDLSWLAVNRRIPARPPAHVQDQHFEFLEYLEVPVRREWNFFFTPEETVARDRWRAERAGRPVLAVVTRSSRREKDWTLARYARVLDTAAGDLGFRTVVVGGPSEGELEDSARLQALCRFPPEVELRYDLREMAWLLDASDAVLSPDTGPLHMAVALGTPTVGLYGFTDPKRVGPYGRYGDLLIDRYSRPDDAGPSRRTRPGRMDRITEEDVIDKLHLLRSRYLSGGADS
ncbi:MAG: glycosyltransferase family 9 protein [Gemmatimonadota bacterium]|nr:glycosyltransferase family 9 protein [Gemmatimonadota bacterium]